MATKPQAKAAIDSVVTLVKADIDLLPAGVDITRGFITFGPNGWTIELFVADLAAGNTLKNAIVTALDSAARPNTTTYKFNSITQSTTWPPSDGVVSTITVVSNGSRFRIVLP